jgi:hypothetical protein
MTVVPESRGSLGALRTPDLSCCRKLAALPESVGNLDALHTLDLDNCYKLKTQLTQLDERSLEQVEANAARCADRTAFCR